MNVEQGAWTVVETLEKAGHEAYLVGGCVRDKLLGREIYDYDITTSALPHEVQTLFESTVPTGIKHGTVSVLIDEERYEVTTFRTDGEYEDGRRPEEVIFVRNLEEDLARRDFTINSMAMGRDGVIRDPFGGQEDLRKKLIRAVGDPVKRFEEDALRMLRGIRFAAQLKFTIEAQTFAAIQYESHSLKQISRERIRDEWHKMLLSSPEIALELLRKTDSLRHVISRPQTFDVRVQDLWGRGVDPWELAGQWATHAPVDLPLRYGIVLTAIRAEEPRIEKTIQELRLSTQLKKEIKSVCHFAGLGNPRDWNDLQWRQLFYKHGAEEVWRGCMLYATLHEPERISEWEAEVTNRKQQQPLWSLQDLAITGQDLIASGVPAGPVVGKVLQRLADSVLREPERNRQEDLLRLAREWGA